MITNALFSPNRKVSVSYIDVSMSVLFRCFRSKLKQPICCDICAMKAF